ncbi:MAG: RibD family protein [Hyphomonadaceae bacterium]|nr:RibD family protein [Hyphomonadaceae bacterium]
MNRPAVTLKLATSLDGRIATAAGESKWITEEAARAHVHRLRAAHDAVLIGVGTALADDPELTARTDPLPLRQPVRVVFDSAARLSPTSRLARTIDAGPVAVLVAADADPARIAALQAAGVVVERLDAPGRIDVDEALSRLAARFRVTRAFLEGGGRLAAAFVNVDRVDRIEWFRAPILLGGDGVPAIGALGLTALTAAPRFRRVAVRDGERDLWETYERAL